MYWAAGLPQLELNRDRDLNRNRLTQPGPWRPAPQSCGLERFLVQTVPSVQRLGERDVAHCAVRENDDLEPYLASDLRVYRFLGVCRIDCLEGRRKLDPFVARLVYGTLARCDRCYLWSARGEGCKYDDNEPLLRPRVFLDT